MAPDPGSPLPSSGEPGDDGADGAPTEPTGGVTTSGADPSTTSIMTGTTGDAADTTTETTPMCGDGVQSPTELCDDGEANGDHAFCTEHCEVNVCGDGLKFESVELCDEGVANSDLYGHYCNTSCAPGKFCGDNVVQAEDGEECDDGPGNGTMEGGASGILCTSMCRLDALRGFVSDEAFTGDLGGLDGADEKCRVAAFTAGLSAPESFHAVISTGSLSANQRFAGLLGEPKPYTLLGGQKFAGSYVDLMSGGPGDGGISVTELGDQLLEEYVATNTAPNGDSATADQDCAGWTSASKDLFARVGRNTVAQDDPNWPEWKAKGWWTSMKAWNCDTKSFHLYCLEF